MRFIDGPNLSEIIDQLRDGCGRLPAPAANRQSTATLPPALKRPPRPAASVERRPRSLDQNGSDRRASGSEDGDELDSDSLQLWADDTSPIAAAPTEDGAPPVPADRSELSGPQHIRRVVRHMIEAARAFDYAHERGVVHRDIKPSNLMLDSNGALWITDFGLARIEADPTFSATGEVMGTLALHESRTGARQAGRRRSSQRHLLARRHAVRAVDADAIFPDVPDPVVLAKIAAEDPDAAATAQPVDPRRPGNDRAQGHVEGGRRALCDGRANSPTTWRFSCEHKKDQGPAAGSGRPPGPLAAASSRRARRGRRRR